MHKLIKKFLGKNTESGIALLFSLAFLALLMVLALAFASNAMIEQKVAYYGQSTISSRMIANSILARIIAVQSYGEDIVCSYNNAGATYDTTSALTTKDGSVYIYKWQSSDANKILWDFIYQNEYLPGDTTPTSVLVGRYAFVVMPPTGELMPVSLVKSKLNEKDYLERRIGQEVNEINIQSVNTTEVTSARADISNFYDAVDTPNGKQPATGWPDFATMFSDLSVTNTTVMYNYKSWFIMGDDEEEEEAYWLDRKRNNFVENVSSGDPDYEYYQRFNLTGTNQSVFDSYNPTGDSYNIWEFINNNQGGGINGNVNNLMDKLILLDFDNNGLRSNSNAREKPPMWVDRDDYTATDGTPLTLNSAYIDMVSPDASTKLRVPGLLWLANFGTTANNSNDNSLKGTFPDDVAPGTTLGITKRRLQIAANLVDYSDSDSIPTSDVAASSWSAANVPKYTGNEKTPYINEIYFNITYKPNLIKIDTDRQLDIDFDFDFGGEVIDIYDCPYAATNITLLSMECKAIFELDSVSTEKTFTVTLSNASGVDSSVDSWTTAVAGKNASAYGYGNISSGGAGKVILYSGPKAGIYENVVFTDLRVVSAKFLLSYGGNNVDFITLSSDSSQNSSASLADTPWGSINSGDTLVSSAIATGFNFQANDPRQNLNPGDWRLDTVYYDTSFVASKNTLAVTDISSATNPATRDQESLGGDASFPAYDYSGSKRTISTAYIRNRPMISPWELGFIHRGKAWQTINLKTYNTNYAISASSNTSGDYAFNIGGGLYEYGDANILDQIKMTYKAKSASKVNIKTKKGEIINALLNKIYINTDPLNMQYTSASYSLGSTYFSYNNTLLDKVCNNTKVAQTRAYLAKIPELTSSNGETDDAKQEVVIGKIINLCKASDDPQYYTAIILAQSIKDVGGNGTDVSISKANADGSTTDTKVNCRLGQFDYKSGSGIIFDEILSTTKIMVRLHVSESNEVKVVSYQYVE